MKLEQCIDFSLGVRNSRLIFALKSVAYRQENSLTDDQ